MGLPYLILIVCLLNEIPVVPVLSGTSSDRAWGVVTSENPDGWVKGASCVDSGL